MDFSLTDEQEALRELARKILADRCSAERMGALESGSESGSCGWYDRGLWSELCRANLPAIALPEEVGGAGLGMLEVALVLEEVGRHLAPAPLFATIVLGGMPIAAFGTSAQRERWLAPVAASEAVLTAALEEPTGFDPALPRTTARRDGAGWRLDGEKTCVEAAPLASGVLVPARTDEGRVGVFLVEPGAAGVALERQISTRREPLSRLLLTGARVGADSLLGALDGPRSGAEVVEWIRERALLGLAAIQLGVAEAAMHQTADYVTQRKQFGRPIGSFQSAQHRLADAWIDVECMRSVVLEAAWRIASGLPAALHVRAAKWWACLAGDRVTHTAQHLHGGIGADVDYPIHRHFLWSQHVLATLGGPRQQLEELGRLLAQDYVPEA
jgi:alkylation response protein AidB-like acyl-CoA dehydrogenase